MRILESAKLLLAENPGADRGESPSTPSYCATLKRSGCQVVALCSGVA
jgi:hypothetical protein